MLCYHRHNHHTGDHDADANHEHFENEDYELVFHSWTEPEACTIMVDPEATVYLIGKVSGGRGMIAGIEAGYWGQSEAVFLDSGAFFSMVSTHHDPNGRY